MDCVRKPWYLGSIKKGEGLQKSSAKKQMLVGNYLVRLSSLRSCFVVCYVCTDTKDPVREVCVHYDSFKKFEILEKKRSS